MPSQHRIEAPDACRSALPEPSVVPLGKGLSAMSDLAEPIQEIRDEYEAVGGDGPTQRKPFAPVT